jgi:OmpA-OmpF porin, OOP family
MRFPLLAILFVGVVMVGPSHAQSGPILKGEEVTEDNIVRALAPSRQFTVEADNPGAVSFLITFKTNSANLTQSALKSIDVLGRALQAEALASLKFAIEGHSDPRGSFQRNMRLSQARAETVVSYLVNNYQIKRDRLSAVGKGSTELYSPADPNASENRRVTIKRLSKETN